MGALAHLEVRLIPVEPGSQAATQIRVRNTGSVVDQFTVEILGDSASWTTVQPPTLSLFPGAEEMATVTFAPPRTPQVPAGQMPFGIRVVSREDPQGSVVEEGALEVAAFSDIFAELAPRTSRGSTGASHDLAIDNRGNAPLNATLAAADPDKLLKFDIRPPSVVAEAGTAAFAKIAVSPTKRFWRGAAQTRPFQVQVQAPGAPPVVVDGSLLQEAILPPWTLKALAAVLGVLILAVLFWVFFLRPTIESTARQELLLAGAPTNAAGSPVLGDGRRDPTPPNGQPTPPPPPTGNGPSTAPPATTGAPPTDSGTPPTTSPPAGGAGTPVTGRLAAGGQPLVRDTPLYLTDLFFSNPGGLNAGSLTLGRAGEPVLVLTLENFRDLDFHFVTPIVLEAGQQLSLTCDGTCNNVALTYSGYTP